MNAEEKWGLVKRNTIEIMGEDALKELITSKKRPVVYLGTAITGSPHVGYFVWALKLADFAKAGFEVKILLADVHGALDNTPWELLDKRYAYYEKVIPLMFESLGVKKSQLEFVKGSQIQLTKNYILDLLKLSSYVSIHDAEKSASEVVKQSDNPKLGGLLYPLMQVLDEEYLEADVQYGGVDQRKIFALATDQIEKLGYKKRVHVMTPLIPGLIGKKMSSSTPASKIDLLDSPEEIEKKVKGAECESGNPDNGVMAFLKNILFTIKNDNNQEFVIERPTKFGGNRAYKNYESLEKDFVSKKIHPLDLKNALAKEIIALLEPIHKNKKSLEKLYKEAYP